MHLFTASLLLFCITTATAASPSATDFENTILFAHNEFRSRLARGQVTGAGNQNLPIATDMLEVIWDDGLAQLASDYANQCAGGHSDKPERSLNLASKNTGFTYTTDGNVNSLEEFIGENIAWRAEAPELDGLEESASSWMDGEAGGYTFGTYGIGDSCSGVCGHMTQGGWGATKYIGCGFADCTGREAVKSGRKYKTFMVCNYYESGNVKNSWDPKAMYTSGSTTCSACPDDYPYCNTGLCATSSSDDGYLITTTTTTTTTTTAPDDNNDNNDDNNDNNDASCVHISDYVSYLNGDYTPDGTVNGKTCYKHEYYGYTFYLYYVGDNGQSWGGAETYYWYISQTKGSSSVNGKCSSKDVLTCGGLLENYSSGGWQRPSTEVNDNCGSGALFDEGEGESGTVVVSNNNGLKIALVLLLIGFLLIVLGNIWFCFYIKRKMVGMRGGVEMEQVLNEEAVEKEDSIEIDVNQETGLTVR